MSQFEFKVESSSNNQIEFIDSLIVSFNFNPEDLKSKDGEYIRYKINFNNDGDASEFKNTLRDNMINFGSLT